MKRTAYLAPLAGVAIAALLAGLAEAQPAPGAAGGGGRGGGGGGPGAQGGRGGGGGAAAGAAGAQGGRGGAPGGAAAGGRGGAAAAPAAPPPPPAPQVIKPVKAGLYMIVNAGGNVTLRVTPAGVIQVDTKNAGQANYDAEVALTKSVTDQPVKFVIDTHVHGDHVGNNGLYEKAGATVIAQENLKTRLANFTPPANNPNAQAPAQPTVTYKDAYTVTLGGAKAELHHYFRGHTDGDTIVYFPDLKTVALGDDLTNAQPNLDYANGASITEWVKTLDEVLKLDFDTAIPGHGPNTMTKAEVKAYRDKLAAVMVNAKAAVAQGATEATLVRQVNFLGLGWVFPANFWMAPGRTEGFFGEASAK